MSASLFFACLLPLLVSADQQPSELPPPGYNGGSDVPQNPSDAGAEGTQKGAFSLSQGAVAAVIAVTVIVIILGVGSGTLWWLAKKRQWDIRQSLRRASRRITGRSTTDLTKPNNKRRANIRLESPPASKNSKGRFKLEADLEKGLSASNKDGRITTTVSSTKS